MRRLLSVVGVGLVLTAGAVAWAADRNTAHDKDAHKNALDIHHHPQKDSSKKEPRPWHNALDIQHDKHGDKKKTEPGWRKWLPHW
jgi:hypothetical protein